MWISLYHANTIDPGFLPRNVAEYDMAIKQVHSKYMVTGDINIIACDEDG